MRCEASVSQFLNRGTDRGGTELPAESYFLKITYLIPGQASLKKSTYVAFSKFRLYFLPLRITSLRVREAGTQGVNKTQRLFKGMNLCTPAMGCTSPGGTFQPYLTVLCGL